jgi:hypothetical protein
MGLLCAKTVKAWHGFESCPVIVSFLPGHVKFFCGSKTKYLAQRACWDSGNLPRMGLFML